MPEKEKQWHPWHTGSVPQSPEPVIACIRAVRRGSDRPFRSTTYAAGRYIAGQWQLAVPPAYLPETAEVVSWQYRPEINPDFLQEAFRNYRCRRR